MTVFLFWDAGLVVGFAVSGALVLSLLLLLFVPQVLGKCSNRCGFLHLVLIGLFFPVLLVFASSGVSICSTTTTLARR